MASFMVKIFLSMIKCSMAFDVLIRDLRIQQQT